MKANHQIKIMLNCSQAGHEKNKMDTLKWLQKILPLLDGKQPAIIEKIFLNTSGQFANFFLS